jgi:outer membrane protein assembly factor BamB
VADSGELSVVSGEKLFRVKPAASDAPSVNISVTFVPGNMNYEDIFSRPVVHKDNLYWVSSGTMFVEKLTDRDFSHPEKFADISRNITTGIASGGDKFAYGTENNGVEVYTFEKDSFYSFFDLPDRVSTTPMIDEDMVYFATESDGGNYLYGMKLDSENLFMLPHPGWEVRDKTFTSPDSWRFGIEDAGISAQPVPGWIGDRKVVFAGADDGVIYAFDPKGKKNKKGEIKRQSWKYKLSRVGEGVGSPLVFDPENKVLYCMGNRGRLYILNPLSGAGIVFAIPETDDYRDFKSTDMALDQGNLCFSVTSKKLASVFYCLNYKSGKYLRVPLPKEAVFKPLIVDKNVYISCRSGEIYNIELPDAFRIKKPKQKLHIANTDEQK